MIPVTETALEHLASCFDIPRAGLTFLGGGREDSDGIAYTYPFGLSQRVFKVIALSSTDPAALVRVHERLKFVHFLGEHGVEIVFPLPREDGSLFATIVEGEQMFLAYTMNKAGGSHLDPKVWDGAFFQRWGQVVGKLHRITQLYPSWQRSLDPNSGQAVLGWEEELQGFYDFALEAETKDFWMAMRARMEKLPIDRTCFGFIHNDPHNWNILVDGNTLTLLDFDVANYHWFVTDISIALQSLLFSGVGGMEKPVSEPEKIKYFMHHFMQGYETENHLDPAWLEQIDLFVSYRRLLLYTVMQGWLSTQPELKAAWRSMILSDPPVTRIK